jgi:hypothetical protein
VDCNPAVDLIFRIFGYVASSPPWAALRPSAMVGYCRLFNLQQKTATSRYKNFCFYALCDFMRVEKSAIHIMHGKTIDYPKPKFA